MKPVDMVVATQLVSSATSGITYQGLSEALQISSSEAHASAKRLITSQLFRDKGRKVPYPKRQALLEFWVHGLKYVYPAQLTSPTRGVATSIGAAPLSEHFSMPEEGPPVWPTAHGTTRGPGLLPIHPSALHVVSDPRAHELLILLDALRSGRAREVEMAQALLKDRLYSWC
ncbi:hypothetical protein [Deinococcus sp. 23YEL01]|jgi:hypothetical protein|uniref:hypothetical protein n=1 Tax=Deinococcus sp. 23YEL01 TaxID=2745871 RepID=UPI001E4D8E3C|nr:hypothetical protein [Deinococcus sp. 23YEL01]MCD0168512.1 MarR family transcriptional regulator [Deinococcus sp. 23YEL01]